MWGKRMAAFVAAGIWARGVVGCSSNDSAPERDFTRLTCAPGTRATNSACVPTVFDEVLIPSQERLSQIDTDSAGVRFVRGSLLVSVKDPNVALDSVKELAARHKGEIIGAIPFGAFYQLSFSDTPSAEALAQRALDLSAEPMVAGVSRDDLLSFSTQAIERPRDSDLEGIAATATYEEYDGTGPRPVGDRGKVALERIGLTQAWDAIYAANPPLHPTTVGILDTIVNHELFPLLSFSGGRDLRIFGTDDSTSVGAYHGTSVATLIGAPNDRSGTTGILGGLSCLHYDFAPMAIVEPRPKETDPELAKRRDRMRLSALFFGIVYAVQAGARVVNGSIGTSAMTGDQRFNLVRNVRLVTSRAPDTLFVFAAGNEGQDAAFGFPCSAARADEDTTAPNVMCVSATAADTDEPAVWYDNTSKEVIGSSNIENLVKTLSIAAPGDRLLAQLPNGKLTMFSGTSGATPLVSGAAGLLYSILPGLDGAKAKAILVDTADAIASTKLSGRRLNIASAVDYALDLSNRLHPELRETGECRSAVDAGTSDAEPAGVCIAPDVKATHCDWFGASECSITRIENGIETTATCEADLRFPWRDDANIYYLYLTVSDPNQKGLFINVMPRELPIQLTGTRSSRSVSMHVESANGKVGTQSVFGGPTVSSFDGAITWTENAAQGTWSATTIDPKVKLKGTFKANYVSSRN